jgi:hypothetical protein
MRISAITGTVVVSSHSATRSNGNNSSSSRGYAVVVEATHASADITQYNSSTTIGTNIVVHGCNLDATALQSLFSIAITSTAATAAVRKPRRALRDRASVTRAEIDRICSEHALDALPESWSYDGQFYIDYRGAQLERRPDTEQLIEQYLAIQNSSIAVYNAAL